MGPGSVIFDFPEFKYIVENSSSLLDMLEMSWKRKIHHYVIICLLIVKIQDVVTVARLKAFRSLKLFRLESFRYRNTLLVVGTLS